MITELWALVLTAVATFLAALAAAFGARATQKASRGQLISILYNEYWSEAYLTAVEAVRSWQRRHGDNYAEKFGEMRRNKDTLSLEEKENLERVDKTRRLIKGYFRKTQQLYSEGYLTKKDVTKLLCPPHRVTVLIDLIEPFEPQIDPNYAREMYDFFRNSSGN